MTWRESLRPRLIAVDAAVLGGLVVGANFLFDRANLGWTALNPSPYLLVPLLLGGRYGFAAGLASGGATTLVVGLLRIVSAGGDLRSTFAAGPYHALAFLFVGGIAGELFAWFRRERAQAEAQLEKLQTSVRRLDADVRYLRGVKDELDRVVATRDGEASALDSELRRLYACQADELPREILQFLKRQARIVDAALYTGAETGEIRRLALVGQDAFLPPTLEIGRHALVQLAATRRSLVALPELLQRKEAPEGEPILLAAPLRNADNRLHALLVVTGLPFVNFTPQAVNLIAMICDWSGEVLDLAEHASGRYRIVNGRTPQRLFSRVHFRHLLQLSLQAHRNHRLPSSVVVFSLPGRKPADQGRFESVLLEAVRAGDYAAELGHPVPHVAVLLPLIGERGANIFVERCRHFLQQGPLAGETLAVRRVELGRIDRVDDVFAELDRPEAPAS